MLVAFSRCEGKHEKRQRRDFEKRCHTILVPPSRASLARKRRTRVAKSCENRLPSRICRTRVTFSDKPTSKPRPTRNKTTKRPSIERKTAGHKTTQDKHPNPPEKKRLLAAPKALSAPTKCPLRGISRQKGPSNPAFMTLARRFLPRTQSPCRIQTELSFAPHFSSFPCLSHSTLPTSAPSLLALVLPLFHTPHSSPSASRFPDLRALRASRAPASEPFALPLPENANRGPDCRENAPVWQKTPLGGLLQQGMSRSLGHIGMMLSHQERKTAGQRIIHCELP